MWGGYERGRGGLKGWVGGKEVWVVKGGEMGGEVWRVLEGFMELVWGVRVGLGRGEWVVVKWVGKVEKGLKDVEG